MNTTPTPNPKFVGAPDFSTDLNSPDVLEHGPGQFYINMGRPGFNSRANNRFGYATRQAALDVISGKRSRR